MSSNLRKWLGAVSAIIGFYIIHEGAHFLVALTLGTFQRIRFFAFGLAGVQIVVDASRMSDFQIAVFCIVGSIASLLVGYILVLCKNRILFFKSKLLKAICYYTTIGFLLLDPLNQSILGIFFGGGDINGIVLFGISEIAARLIFAVIGIVNLYFFIKYVYPAYKKNFSEANTTRLEGEPTNGNIK